MRRFNFLLVAGLMILTSCAPEKGVTKMLVARDPGGAVLGNVRLPGNYYDAIERIPLYDHLKSRASKAPTDEVLLRFYDRRLEGVVMSDECFAVSADGKFTMRKANLEEWDKADPAESRDVENANEDTVWAAGGWLTFHAKEFRLSGHTEGRGFGSANGKYLATLSTTVREHRSWFEMPAPGLGHGETVEEYVEIFDVRSGNRLLAAFSTELGTLGAGFGTWLKDRFFILPYSVGHINHDMRFCFLGILPDN